jgi:hypothetical protein
MDNPHGLVTVRRKKGYAPVSTDLGVIGEGELTMMPRVEAEAREDWEITEEDAIKKSEIVQMPQVEIDAREDWQNVEETPAETPQEAPAGSAEETTDKPAGRTK